MSNNAKDTNTINSNTNTNTNQSQYQSNGPMKNFTCSPSSIEEAAALLGASITRLQNDQVYRTTTPPAGLHSSFSIVHPSPCSELYIRLASLHALLKDYADLAEEEMGLITKDTTRYSNAHEVLTSSSGGTAGSGGGKKRGVGGGGSKEGKSKTLSAAPSIIQLLHKLLPMSSSLVIKPVFLHSSTNSLPPPNNPLASVAGTPTSPNNNNNNERSSSPITVPTTTATSSSSNYSPTRSSKSSRQQQKNPNNPNNSSNNNNHNNNKHQTSQKQLQVPPLRITPPLSSQPLRHLWVQCVTLAHRLAPPPSANAASDPSIHQHEMLRFYMRYVAGHPRSAKSSGGTRIACLAVLVKVFEDEVLGGRWVRVGIAEGITLLCLNGLRYSGNNDVTHRLHSMQLATAILTAWRDAPPLYTPSTPSSSPTPPPSFWSDSASYLEDRVLAECLSTLKKAAGDKYAEVRRAGAEYAGVLCGVVIEEERIVDKGGDERGGGSNANQMFNGALTSLDEVMQVCFRNVDEEGAGVAIVWCEALARCICTSLEYQAHVRLKRGRDQGMRRMDDVGDGDGGTGGDLSTGGGSGANDGGGGSMERSRSGDGLASKLKAFSESRRSNITSSSCSSLSAAMRAIVQCFIKVGGDLNAPRMGGSFSVGGRHTRVGLGLALLDLCKLQCIAGGISSSASSAASSEDVVSPSDALKIVLQMVGPSLEVQLDDHSDDPYHNSSYSNSSSTLISSEVDATSSPRRSTTSEKSSMAGLFGGIGGTKKSPSDAGMARLTTNRVIRRGILEMVSEPVQLALMRDLIDVCGTGLPSSTSSTDVTSTGTGGDTSINDDNATTPTVKTTAYSRHQIQVALIEISHLITTLGEASSSTLSDLIPALQRCLSDSDHGVRLEAATAYQAVTVVFPSAGRRLVMIAVDKIQQHRDEIVALASSVVRKRLDEGGTASGAVTEEVVEVKPATPVKTRRRFRRGTSGGSKKELQQQQQQQQQEQKMKIQKLSTANRETDMQSLNHQYIVHGYALVLSMVLHVLPNLPGGLPAELLEIVVAVSEALVECLHNEDLCHSNQGALCTCVRAGYCVMSGVLTMGPEVTVPHFPNFLKTWIRSTSTDYLYGGSTASNNSTTSTVTTKTTDSTTTQPKKLESAPHELSCLESLLTSIVVFLRENSTLLLSIPNALNSVTQVLERSFTVFSNYDRLPPTESSRLPPTRLAGARSSLFEAFSWLPPGSFPLVADGVFSSAGELIRVGGVTSAGFAAAAASGGAEDEIVACSLLPDLVDGEDDLLNVCSMGRASGVGQTGGVVTVEDHLVGLTCGVVSASEREAVLHFLSKRERRENGNVQLLRHTQSPGSMIGGGNGGGCGKIRGEDAVIDLPTPLHEVGMWKEPSQPSRSSKVRLLNAAIHVFAATFGMQDGQKQANAVKMLESLVLNNVAQNNRPLLMSERANKQHIVSATNVSAALISCLQALPLHDGSNGAVVGMGPPWMARATMLFCLLLRSSAPLVRRVSAEGLGLLASLGVTEDAHTLQSSILHSIEELMQGNTLDNMAPQKMQYAASSSTTAGCLLTFGCIQRTSQRMARETARARARFAGRGRSYDDELNHASSLPTMLMLTRALPYIATHTGYDDDSFLTRTYALHSFMLLLSYSNVVGNMSVTAAPEDERYQILSKAVEIVENNFFAAWKTNMTEVDSRSRETEKLTVEPAFLIVLIRLMTFLLPHLCLLADNTDSTIAGRFSSMVAVMISISGYHASVVLEGVLFFDNLACRMNLLTRDDLSVSCVRRILTLSLNFATTVLSSSRMQIRKYCENRVVLGCDGSNACYKAAVGCIDHLIRFSDRMGYSSSGTMTTTTLLGGEGENFHRILFALLERTCGAKQFTLASAYRNVAVPYDAERSAVEMEGLEYAILGTLEALLLREIKMGRIAALEGKDDGGRMLHWTLFAKSLLTGEFIQSADQLVVHDDDDDNDNDNEDGVGISDVVDTAIRAARVDTTGVLMYVSPCRWQVKYQAAKLANIALKEISDHSPSAPSTGTTSSETDSNFDILLARDHLRRRCATISNDTINESGNDASSSSGPTIPSSRVAFHFDELITAACSITIATLDQAELYCLQNAGLRLLILLINCFADVLDPDEGVITTSTMRSSDIVRPKLLEQYIPQITASVKHAINYDVNAEIESTMIGQSLHTLFMSGCEGLLLLIRTGLVSDPSTVKRMMRPLMPSKEDLVVCPYPTYTDPKICALSPKPKSFVEDRMATLLPRVAKLWTLAEVGMLVQLEYIPHDLSSEILQGLSPGLEEGIAINCAAIAIDAFRLKTCHKTASSISSSESKDEDDKVEGGCMQLKSGLTFSNFEDVDDFVKDGMVQTWAVLSGFSVVLLLKTIKEVGSSDNNRRSTLVSWLKNIVTVVFAGLYDSLECLRVMSKMEDSKSLRDAEKTSTMCLAALGELIQSHEAKNIISSDGMKSTIHCILETVLFPSLGLSYILSKYDKIGRENKASEPKDGEEISLSPDSNNMEWKTDSRDEVLKQPELRATNEDGVKELQSFNVESEQVDAFHIATVYFANGKPSKLIEQACNLLEAVCNTKANWCFDRKTIMKILLLPLIAVEDGSIDCDSNNEVTQVVLSSIIRCVQRLVESEQLDYGTVKGLLIFSLSKISCICRAPSEQSHVKTALCALLRTCLQKSNIPKSEKLIHVQETAKSDNWEAWEILCLDLDQSSGINHSIDIICQALEDYKTPRRHVDAFAAILSISSIRTDWVPLIMRKVGGQVLQLTKLYGNCQLEGPVFNENRTSMCAMSIKMIMLTFQYMNTDKVVNAETVSFHTIVFEALVSLVSFNGLPSQSTSTLHASADPALGRICAQFFVHILRLAPALFKACLVNISAEDRSVLEAAVRADMEGYQKKKVAVVKKPLKLKSFARS